MTTSLLVPNKVNSYNGDVMQNIQGGLKVVPIIKLSLIKRLRLIIVFINFNPLQPGVAYLYSLKTSEEVDKSWDCNGLMSKNTNAIFTNQNQFRKDSLRIISTEKNL